MSALQSGLTPKMRPLPQKRSGLVAALDVGTSKVACLIARLRPREPDDVLRHRTHSIDVLGFGHTVARGMKAGSVVDLAGSAVGERDIARVLTAGSRHSIRAGRAVLHSLPLGYRVDDATGVRDPRGMLARRFGIDMHVVTTDISLVRNLMLAVERCHLNVEAMVTSSYVAGLSVLADDEAELGAAVIDLGAGTTSIAVFAGGQFVHADGFALGGRHVTLDLARGLHARIPDAERLKALYGGVLIGGSDEREMIAVPPVDDDEMEAPQFVSRASLVRFIKPRIEEIFEMVRDRLAASPFAAELRGRVVLTGGARPLTGLAGLVGHILARSG